MKIFAAGIATETNTFSPVVTGLEDFFVQRGTDVAAGHIPYPTQNLFDPWGRQAAERGADFVFSLMAWAPPAGRTLDSAYETLLEEILGDLRAAMPVDVVLLMLHGAMVSQSCEDCEEDMVRRVREVVGPSAVIGVELDLHCHLRETLLELADLIILFKEYPHVDITARARELFDLAVATQAGQIKPTMALFDCKMIGLYPTTRDPMRQFVDAMTAAERRPGVLSLSFGHGFQYADVPHVGAKMLAVTNNDPPRAQQLAQEFGRRVYDLRRTIGFDSISVPMEVALTRAVASRKIPVVVADQSDNPGGGAPSDSTFVLRWLLDRNVQDVATALFYDPGVVKLAKKAGQGATLSIRLGGKMGPLSGDPVDIEVTVGAMLDDYLHAFPQQTGDAYYPAGDIVALRCGTLDIVVGTIPCQCFSPAIFSDLGIDPLSKRLLIPKSVQHFYGAFAPIAAEIIYMAAPGAVAPDPRLISYRRFDPSGKYPWVDDPLG